VASGPDPVEHLDRLDRVAKVGEGGSPLHRQGQQPEVAAKARLPSNRWTLFGRHMASPRTVAASPDRDRCSENGVRE